MKNITFGGGGGEGSLKNPIFKGGGVKLQKKGEFCSLQV